ncbi:MAG TPA: DUF2318 domain-containing protein [Blastocatellia bacterium]|jgi:hypothetical protein|nr:DUF2318 domain-containing protein [Blastocatellia bacterium]
MSHRHRSHANYNRQHKRAQFSSPAQQKTNKTTVTLVIALTGLLAVIMYLLLGGINEKPVSTSVRATTPAPTRPAQPAEPASLNASAPVGGDIRIPLSDIETGKAKFFDFTSSDNRSVRFFAIKSSDGVYRAALDACDVCYAAKKGYYQDGDNMVCKKCSRQFPSALVNEVSGGCNPIGLPRTVDGDTLVIKAGELESRRSYF